MQYHNQIIKGLIRPRTVSKVTFTRGANRGQIRFQGESVGVVRKPLELEWRPSKKISDAPAKRPTKKA